MQILVTVLAVVLLAMNQPAGKPNFSGEWKMNEAKSNFGGLPGPTSITRSIKHAEPKLTIVEQQTGGMGDSTITREYVTDGTPTSFQAQGATVDGSAKWDANTLVVVSKVEMIGLAYNDRMTLSEDGKTMTSVVKLSSPQGEVELTVVFERQ